MRLKPRSIRSRLALSYAAVLAVLLLSLAAAGLLLTRRTIFQQTDQFLVEATNAFAAELEAERAEMPTFEAALDAALKEFQFSDIRISVLDGAPPYTLLGSGPEPPISKLTAEGRSVSPDSVRTALLAGSALSPRALTLEQGEVGYRIALTGHHRAGQDLWIAAGRSLRNEHEGLKRLFVSFVIAAPLLLLIAAGAGSLFAWRSLLPVAVMSREASAISATNLHDRLPVNAPEDELGRLAGVINALLDRLEHSFGQQRRFMTDASHELRTPVAVVRNEAEIALARMRTPEEYQEALAVVRGEGVRLSRIVDDLFLLSRADTGEQPVIPAEMYLADLVSDVVRSLQSLASARDIMLDCETDGESPYRGDFDLLQRLLRNLIDNAIKHAPRGGWVHVALARTQEGYDLRVTDNGPGVPAHAQLQIFDRFFRADESRSRNGSSGGGAGLGLAIARWVAEAHNGTLALTRSDGTVTEFRLTLPWPQSLL